MVYALFMWRFSVEKAAKSKNELVAYYKKARQTMSKAAKDVRASAVMMAKKDRMLVSPDRSHHIDHTYHIEYNRSHIDHTDHFGHSSHAWYRLYLFYQSTR